MAQSTADRVERKRGIGGLAKQANPAFAGGSRRPLIACAGALASEHRALTFVHVMAGLLWTGTDLFMGAILGPVIGGLTDERAACSSAHAQDSVYQSGGGIRSFHRPAHAFCWEVPQPGRGTNFWIPLAINPANSSSAISSTR